LIAVGDGKRDNSEALKLHAYLEEKQFRVEEALARFLPAEDVFPPVIFRAMRHSVLAGGKRLRPILCLAAAEAVGGEAETVLPVACALEFIHTYSLIHDDLPAMDDDDLRRGRPTSHKVFGEDIAILAGDALLTEAFHLLSRHDGRATLPPARRLAVIHDIAAAAGFRGMVGGQVVDVQSAGKAVDRQTLHYIHTRKTGAMIVVSVRAGAILAGADAGAVAALTAYGEQAGLAFQIADDILNVEGDARRLGKTTGSDAARGKITYPALMGLAASKRKTRHLVRQAVTSLKDFDHRADPLRWIATYIIQRQS